MKTWQLESLSFDGLHLRDLPAPSPGPRRIVARVRATSVNPHDVMLVTGAYGRVPLPFTPLGDGAGEVVGVGSSVTRFALGDRVVGAFLQGWTGGRPPADVRDTTLGGHGGPTGRAGTAAELVLLDEAASVRLPASISYEEAATLPIAGVTAWHALFVDAPVRPGQTVLVQGTGGVAVFAIQLAAAAGARVIVTSSSEAKLVRARELGATDTIHRATVPDWVSRARQLTGGVGVDLVVDVAGELGRSAAALRFGGQVSAVGLLAGPTTPLDVVPLLQNRARIQGIATGSTEMLANLVAAIDARRLRPVVDRVHAFEDLPRALGEVSKGDGYFGQIVVRGPA